MTISIFNPLFRTPPLASHLPYPVSRPSSPAPHPSYIVLRTSYFVLLLLLSGTLAFGQSARKPNILFIMSDDHASQAISCYGSPLIQTPNIDRIAREGIRFDQSFVTNSICAPSRAVMLTGKYSHLNGLRDNRDVFDGAQATFPKMLRQAGYFTAVVGKWHLKSHPTGFDHWKVLIDQGEYYNPRLIDNGDTTSAIGYTTDLITDYAIQTLEQRDPNQPFCLLVHHKAPHRNWQPNGKHLSLYENQDLPLPETFWDNYESRSPAAREQDMRIGNMFLSYDLKLFPGDYPEETGTGGNGDPLPSTVNWWLADYNRMTPEQKQAWDAHYGPVRAKFRENPPTGKALTEWMYQRYIKDYLRCVASVDENIGRLLDYLDQKGLAENTLVVYTSDQGFYLGEHGWYDKRFMYEPSFTTPLVMRYPKAIPAGKISRQMALNLDLAPTFLTLAGIAPPAEMQGLPLQNIWNRNQAKNWRNSVYYHYYEYPHGWHQVKKHYGVRTERYKLIHFYDDIDAWELYDLKKDPNELHNLIDDPKQQNRILTLKAELNNLRAQYRDAGD